MTRKEAITVIRQMLATTDLSVRANLTKKMIEACHMAISSLETDEAYQLKYEKPSGKWINISHYDHGYGVNKTCSICNHTISGQVDDLSEYNYCPNCGAKMESEDKE